MGMSVNHLYQNVSLLPYDQFFEAFFSSIVFLACKLQLETCNQFKG